MTTASHVADRTDAELAELARGGDPEAWGALVDRGLLDGPGRDLLRRFFVSNQSYRTIAEELDVPVAALPTRIAWALDDLCQASRA